MTTYSPLRVLATALMILLGGSLVALGLTASTACTPSQLRTASAVIGAVGPLACTAGVAQIDGVPGWSITACVEAAELTARLLAAKASADEVDAGAEGGGGGPTKRVRVKGPKCVGVIADGRVVAMACRTGAM